MSILYPIPICRTGSRGNVSITSSLVGAPELERYFPDHQLKIWVGSWNMGDRKVSARVYRNGFYVLIVCISGLYDLAGCKSSRNLMSKSVLSGNKMAYMI
jgi:hypothetical protein